LSVILRVVRLCCFVDVGLLFVCSDTRLDNYGSRPTGFASRELFPLLEWLLSNVITSLSLNDILSERFGWLGMQTADIISRKFIPDLLRDLRSSIQGLHEMEILFAMVGWSILILLTIEFCNLVGLLRGVPDHHESGPM
jgi:hypothetical protein